MDLGATRGSKFRPVTFPACAPRCSPRAAGVRAVLRRDHRDHLHRRRRTETLPIWILNNLTRPNNAPVVNVVGTVLIVLSILPVYLSPESFSARHRGRL